jgi:hypothetical protein
MASGDFPLLRCLWCALRAPCHRRRSCRREPTAGPSGISSLGDSRSCPARADAAAGHEALAKESQGARYDSAKLATLPSSAPTLAQGRGRHGLCLGLRRTLKKRRLRMSLTAAALSLLVLPLGAIDASASQDRPVETPRAESSAAAPAPSWSIGAGLGLTCFAGPTFLSSAQSVWQFPTLAAPRVTTSLERALSARTWLIADVAASFQNLRGEGSASAQSSRYSSIFADVGVRRVLTPASAPVEVSALALLVGGYRRGSYTLPDGSDSTKVSDYSWSQWNVGVAGGVAVERHLIQNLSVRISTPILFAGYARNRASSPNSQDVSASGMTAGLQLAPRLDLRLAF